MDPAGIPKVLESEVLVAPFNDAAAASALIEEHRDELAGVIMEPMQRLIPPQAGFLETVRAVTAKIPHHDSVVGFRINDVTRQVTIGTAPRQATIVRKGPNQMQVCG